MFFGCAPHTQLGGREDICVDVGRRQVTNPSGVLMRTHHRSVDSHHLRPALRLVSAPE